MRISFAAMLVAVCLSLALVPRTATASTHPFVIDCNNCDSISTFNNRIISHMIARQHSGDTREGVYMVASKSRAMIALAETRFQYDPWFGTYFPQIRLITETKEELLLADQFLVARAIVDRDHVDDLPTVEFGGNPATVVGQGDYQQQASLWMNGNPAVTMLQQTDEIPWTSFINKVRSLGARIRAGFGSTDVDVYVKVVFSDGSYGVFYIADTTTAGVFEVYYVDAEGNVYIIDEDLIDEVEDPALDDPEIEDDIEDDVPNGTSSSFQGAGDPFGGPNGAGQIATVIFFGSLGSSDGGGREGYVFIEDLID